MDRAFDLNIDESGCARLVFDLPGAKVNKLTMRTLDEIEGIVDSLRGMTAVRALSIFSRKRDVFIAGADIDEIAGITDAQQGAEKAAYGQKIIDGIATLPFPTIAVINGACLGGGLELALACDYRIATDNVKTTIGLPEVTLGIIPGFGGTQRLPRLIGLKRSLPLILTGKPVDGRRALKCGLVDACVPNEFLEEKVADFVQGVLKGNGLHAHQQRQTHGLKNFLLERNAVGRGLFLYLAKKQIAKKVKSDYPAPYTAIDVIRRTYGLPLDKGLAIEAEEFGKLVSGEVSRNLIKLFYTREKMKKDRGVRQDISYPPLNAAGVLGAGVMGGGISWLFTKADIPVRLKDLDWHAIQRGFQTVSGIYAKLKKLRKFDAREINLRMHRLTGGIDYRGFSGLDFVLEAVVEDPAVKASVYSELEGVVSENAIIATNTSTLPISELGESLKHPERFIGMHFFNPANRMPLVEVIPGDRTAPETTAAVVDLAKRLGKTPIVVKSAPGFLVNRLLLPYLNEAFHLLSEDRTAQQIDKAIYEFGMPMGPLRLVDEIGIDVSYKAARILNKAYGSRMDPAPIFADIYETKSLTGKNGGKGIYLYGDGEKNLSPEFIEIYERHTATGERVEMPDSERTIRERLLLTMINEASRCLSEGIIESPDYLDMALIMGTGFPAFRGGLLRYADKIGIDKIIKTLQAFEQKYGMRFQPSEYLMELSRNQSEFYA